MALLMAWMPPPTGIVVCHCDVSESITQRESIHVRSQHNRLPVLVPELAYDDLDIQEGASASRLWKEVTLTNPEAPVREKVYADLVDYCTRDTWAMVAIHRALMML